MAPTRALLLSTYIKWVNVFPEIKPQLVNVFERYRHVLDVDLQQRACEFYALSTRPDDDELLQNVCEEIPPFPPRESALLGRLNRKHSDTGGKDFNLERQGSRRLTRKPTLGDVNGHGGAKADVSTDITSSLIGLDLTSSPGGIQTSQTLDHASAAVLAERGIPRLTNNPNIERWYDKLTYTAEGVLYEDVQIQIGIKSRYHGPIGQLAVYIGNKISAPLESFTTTLHVEDHDALAASFAKISPSIIAPRSQTQLLLNIECKKVFTTAPILSVSFLAGAHQTIAIRLPIVITKFFEHVKLGPAEFFDRWKLIGGPPRESQSIFPIVLNDAGHVDVAKQRQVISGYSLNVLEGIDPNPTNTVAAGILHTSVDGKVGCLLRLEPNKEAKVRILVHESSRKLLIYIKSFAA